MATATGTPTDVGSDTSSEHGCVDTASNLSLDPVRDIFPPSHPERLFLRTMIDQHLQKADSWQCEGCVNGKFCRDLHDCQTLSAESLAKKMLDFTKQSDFDPQLIYARFGELVAARCSPPKDVVNFFANHPIPAQVYKHYAPNGWRLVVEERVLEIIRDKILAARSITIDS